MLQNFGTALSREQMKKVMGGYGQTSCQCTVQQADGTYTVTAAWYYSNNATPPKSVTDADIAEYCTSNGAVGSCCISC